MLFGFKVIKVEWKRLTFYHSVHPEMMDFGSGQGRSDFATAGIAGPEVVSEPWITSAGKAQADSKAEQP
jgi:hypothetical protein